MNRLAERYQKEVKTKLFNDLKLANVNQTPRLTKIVVSAGVGRAVQDDKYLETVLATLTAVSGQRPVQTKAKNSIATFKLREGNPIGAKVTLRGEMMWNFLDRLIAVTLPRLRDFRGLNLKAFDGHGNYNIGITEQAVFPEISYDQISNLHGLQITLVTNTEDDKQAEALMRELGLPLERNE